MRFTREQAKELREIPTDAERYQKLLRHIESLTPGGSEFHNDPLWCLNYLVDDLDSTHKHNVELTKRLREGN